MTLKNIVEDQMASRMCILKNPITWIVILVPLFLCAGFSCTFCFSLLITSLVLILSTLFFTFSKQNPALVRIPVQDEALSSDKKCPLQVEEESIQQPQSEVITEITEVQENGVVVHSQDYVARSLDLCLENESIDHPTSSEDSDVDWSFSGEAGRGPDCSDGSISDEESLIEIALPSGQSIGSKEASPKFNLLQKLPDFSLESIFKQDSLVELLAEINEVNEEENLIEIDISMGSIKCSRFEIEA
ncbi:unnamed protein product [Ilex paraguariensis]|uniref:Transmembrane protein n=1 Tax=Ilex paraguariensis TaxID=185542 RepID=A0ABC8TIR9_9AQUA